MFFEQYSHEPSIAVSRHWMQHLEMTPAQCDQLPAVQEGGHAALAVMESHLRLSQWFVGDEMSIADIALYAYTHVADEGGFDLVTYPAVSSWLELVAGRRWHIPMNPAPVGIVEPFR